MQRGGRPKHNFWEEGGFKSIRQNGKQVASCLRCNKIINNTAEQRLKSHRKTCIWEVENSNIDDSSDGSVVRHLSLKRKNRSGSYEENNNCTTTCNSTTTNTDGVITLSTVKLKKNTPKINSFIDKISETEHSKLDEALSYFFFSKNLPLDLVEDEYFIKFCKTLRSAYQIPSQTELSTCLLDNAHNKFINNQVNMSEKQGILLFCKNIDCTTFLEIIGIIKAGSNTLFIKSWSFKDEKDYSDNYFKMVEESNVIILKKYDLSIYSVVFFVNILTIDNTRDSTLTVTPTCKSTVKWHLTCHLETVDTLTTSIQDDVLDIKVNRLLNKLKDTNVESEIVKRNGDKKSQLKEDVFEHSYYSKLLICLKNLTL
ncbi:uncharacterized protein LOC123266735 isoform X2 [Cotesia glomerata]|uniref:uncharacterized protein LOC123266735 isoform X2 n=1 Tax=Cotesia glomerata TaxID=32391 RepID=UPI001D00C623|nr:uncharacterized protein LOC123266735 isoform X2 [Cotesia glomerata]